MRTVICLCLWAGMSAAVACAADAPSAPEKTYGAAPNTYSLPPTYSSFGKEIDSLFWIITALVGVLFVGTEAGILWFILVYRRREGVKSSYIHGNTTLEVIWTIIPAAILVWLSLYQKALWDKLKINIPAEPAAVVLLSPEDAKKPDALTRGCAAMAEQDVIVVQILAKQFDWSFRYQGPDDQGRLAPLGTKWDVYSDRLIVPYGKKVVFHVSSKDVIHSFWLPNFRVKQDAVPGLTVRGWFDMESLPEADVPAGGRSFEIVCAELCGAQHYKMSGVMIVYSAKEFAEQMKRLIENHRNDDLIETYGGGKDPRHGKVEDTQKVWANYRMPADAARRLAEYVKAAEKAKK